MPLGRFSRCGEHAVGRATMEPAGKKGFVALGTQVHNLPRWLPPFPPLTGVDEASKTLSAFLHIAPLCPFLSLRVVKQSLFDLHGCGPPPHRGQ